MEQEVSILFNRPTNVRAYLLQLFERPAEKLGLSLLDLQQLIRDLDMDRIADRSNGNSDRFTSAVCAALQGAMKSLVASREAAAHNNDRISIGWLC